MGGGCYYCQDLTLSTQVLYRSVPMNPWKMLEHFYKNIVLSQTKTETSSFSLSISFENVDTTKKKLPVHTLDGLTLSYKVSTNHFFIKVVFY